MAPTDAPRHNLPLALTSFVGRERDLAAVRAYLGTARLLTLTGAGGCGKTRLALEAASQVVAAYADGVWFIDLAPLADPALVPQTIAAVLGVVEQPGQPLTATLAVALRFRRLLLVLDNCEHLLDACASLVEALLTTCADLTVLATSRELLGVPGEVAWRVPSLTLPGSQARHDEVLAAEAVRLFVERVRLTRPDFAITEHSAPAVIEICRRLDGIPLALELAAARVSTLSVDEIAARLHDRFRLLTGGRRTGLRRQQTLEAAMAWSYDLLTEPEQALLRRLAVFAGGWTLAAAEVVVVGDGIEGWQVLDLLTRLVEKSLVVAEEHDGGTRYRLLETVRQYAEEQVLAAGEAAAARDRHLAWCAALAAQAEPVLWGNGTNRDDWMLRLQLEHDNLRAALEWSVESDSATGLRLAVSLAEFWRMARAYREGCQWLDTLLERELGQTSLQAYALLGIGRLYREQGELVQARERLTDSAAIFGEIGDQRGLATALSRLGLIADADGDAARARVLQEESLALCRALGDRQGLANALLHLGIVLTAPGTLAEARAAFEESLPHFQALRDTSRVAHVLHWLSLIARLQGEYTRAHTLVMDALTVGESASFKDPVRSWSHHTLLADLALVEGKLADAATEYQTALVGALAMGHHPSTVYLITVLSMLAIRQGMHERGVRWLAAIAHERLDTLKAPGLYQPALPSEREYSLVTAQAALGAEAFAAAWVAGQALTVEQTAAEALVAPPIADIPPAALAPLTAREREVAGLIAQGLTNRQIAEQLSISPHTVERHVENILNRLGLASRAQIAAWIVEQRAPAAPGN